MITNKSADYWPAGICTLTAELRENSSPSTIPLEIIIVKAKDVIKNINLREDGFGFEPEVTAKISKKNLKIYEVGVKYFGRKYEEGKKITWKDGLAAIYFIIYYNLKKK